MASTTTLNGSPSRKSTSSSSSNNGTTELLLIPSALNGSTMDKDPLSSTVNSDPSVEKERSSSSSSYYRSNSAESADRSQKSAAAATTRLQYNSNLEAEQVPIANSFLKISPSNCAKSTSPSSGTSGKNKTMPEKYQADFNSREPESNERENEEDEEQLFSTQSQLNPNEDENENDGDLASISEASVSQSHSLQFTDSIFLTPSSSLYNLALTLDAESPSQETRDLIASYPQLDNSKTTDQLKLHIDTEINGNNLESKEGFPIESPVSSANSAGSEYNFTPSPCSEFTQSAESNTSRDEDLGSSGNYGSSREKDLLQPGNYNAKPIKKKMWYHVFTPSYKSRVGDFKKNFKDLTTEERLIVDYSCAIQKDILVQGRMYVSQNYVCFHANIFGWETQTLIKFKEITSITKEKTALVIPNAIQLSTDSEKYFFTSFVTRDSAYVMLFKLWQSSLLDQGLSPKEIWKLVRASYGDELGINSEVETDEFLSISPSNLVKAASVSTLISSTSEADDNKSIQIDMVSADEPNNDAASGDISDEKSATLTNANAGGGIRRRPDLSQLSDSSDSEAELGKDKLILEIPKCPVDHPSQGRELVNAIIPCDIDTLFTLLFTNSKFYLDFHTSRKTFDIVQSDWEESPEAGKKMRHVSFTVTLNQVMGPKHSQVTETQTMLPESKPGRLYAIDYEANNSGIPYADSFYVAAHYCLSRINAHQSNLIVICQIKYRKSVWGIKGFIERNSWAGLTEFYTHLERALKEECLKSCASPPTSPRMGEKVTRRLPPRKKYPAPAIPGDSSAAKRTGSLGRNAVPPTASGIEAEPSSFVGEGSFLLKAILTILAGLLILNAFLYVKLASLETATSTPAVFSIPKFTLPEGDMPQTHQEWLVLLQKQEALHRLELQKWHDILLSALKILRQAEDDLEMLKLHVAKYNDGYGNLLKETMFKPTDTNENSQTPSLDPEHVEL